MLTYPSPKGLQDTIKRMESLINHRIEDFDDITYVLTAISEMNPSVRKELAMLRYRPEDGEGNGVEEDIIRLRKYRLLTWAAGNIYASIEKFAREQYATFEEFENKLMCMTEGMGQVEAHVISECTDFTTPCEDRLPNVIKILQDRA